MVAFGSGPLGVSPVSGLPSSKQKFRERSVYVRPHVGQRFIAAQLIGKLQILSRAKPRVFQDGSSLSDSGSAAAAELCAGRIAGFAGPAEHFHGFRRPPLEGWIAQWDAATPAELDRCGVRVPATRTSATARR